VKRRQALSARGRRGLAWGLALFALGQLALALAAERGHPELIDPEYGRRFQQLQARRQEAPGRPLLLMLGSSRTAMGFRPDALPPLPAGAGGPPLAFNYSLVSAGPLTELLCLERLAAGGVRPDAVLIEVWLPHLGPEKSFLTRLDQGVRSDLRLADRYSPEARPGCWRCLERRLLPAYFLRSGLQREWLPPQGPAGPEAVYWSTLDGSGWLPCPWDLRATGAYATFAVKQQADYGPTVQRFGVTPAGDRALHDMLVLCRRRGIKAALVWMPEASDFRRYYSPDALAGMRAYLAALSDAYQAPCLDMREWAPDEDFADGFHLTPAGAARLTERLGREFLAPWLDGRALSGAGPASAQEGPAPSR
jgi:hypothetical protein